MYLYLSKSFKFNVYPPLLLINEISLLSVKIKSNSQQKQARERGPARQFTDHYRLHESDIYV